MPGAASKEAALFYKPASTQINNQWHVSFGK